MILSVTSSTVRLIACALISVAVLSLLPSVVHGVDTASYTATDSFTQGNWKGAYGSGGYRIVGDAANDPSFATVTVSGALEYTWAASTSDGRGLQKSASGSTDRIAATDYSDQFSIDIACTDAASHAVAVYLLAWDRGDRSQLVEVLDGATGTVLDSRVVSNFSGGTYLVWTITGHVTIRTTVQSGYNAVISGLFFGITPPASAGTATYAATDRFTQGDWKGVYGADGYRTFGDAASDPSYAAVAVAGALDYTWQSSTTDGRALRRAASGSTDRMAACSYNDQFAIDIACADSAPHTVAVYALDWDRDDRSQLVEVLDGGTGAVLDARPLSDFSRGAYLVWTITGHVKIRATVQSGYNAVISGVFFGHTTPSSAGTATFAATDTFTQGDWKTAYGTQGYQVFGDGGSDPGYATVGVAGAIPYTWEASTADGRALQKVAAGTDRIAACDYDGQFTIDVACTDSAPHSVAIYAVDWDRADRTQTVEVLDGGTGAVLDTRSLANFSRGIYLSWTISGHVKIRTTPVSGVNAVLSGVFFGVTPATAAGTATYITTDVATQGSWKGVYGSDGFRTFGDVANDPSYATIAMAGALEYTWAASTSDIRALQKGASGSTDRIAATDYDGQFAIDIACAGSAAHQVAIYALDWDSQGRTETVDVLDGRTGAVLDTRPMSSFSGGTYVVWSVTGHVKIRVSPVSGINAVISGVFFGSSAATNQAPSFAIGPNQTVFEDAGAQSISGWATAISAGPASEASQVVTFSVSSSNTALFSAQPTISSTGTLTFTPASNANGAATITVVAHDDGGTANGGVDASAPQTATITVTAVNDAPSFSKGPDQHVDVSAGPQSVPGWATAIAAGPTDEATQTLDFLVSADHPEFFAAVPAITSDGTLTYTPGTAGIAVVTVQLRDSGGVANGGVNVSVPQTFQIVITSGGGDGGGGGGNPIAPVITQVTIDITGGTTGDLHDAATGDFFTKNSAVTVAVTGSASIGTITGLTVTSSDGQSVSCTGGTCTFSPSAEGRITLTATAIATHDGLSTSMDSPAITLVYDLTPPTISSFQTSDGSPLRASMTDQADWVLLNGATAAIDSGLRTTRGMNVYPKSDFSCRALVSDDSGLSISAAPTATAGGSISAASSAAGSPQPYVKISGFSGLSESETFDAGTLFATAVTGAVTVHVTVTDRCGNTAQQDLFQVWVDTVPPVVKLGIMPYQFSAKPTFQVAQDQKTELIPARILVATADTAEIFQGAVDSNPADKLVSTPAGLPTSSTDGQKSLSAWRLKTPIRQVPPTANDWEGALANTAVIARDFCGNASSPIQIVAHVKALRAVAPILTHPEPGVLRTTKNIDTISEQPLTGSVKSDTTSVVYHFDYDGGTFSKAFEITGPIGQYDEMHVTDIKYDTSPLKDIVYLSRSKDLADDQVKFTNRIRTQAPLTTDPPTFSPRIINVPPSWQTGTVDVKTRIYVAGIATPFVQYLTQYTGALKQQTMTFTQCPLSVGIPPGYQGPNWFNPTSVYDADVFPFPDPNTNPIPTRLATSLNQYMQQFQIPVTTRVKFEEDASQRHIYVNLRHRHPSWQTEELDEGDETEGLPIVYHTSATVIHVGPGYDMCGRNIITPPHDETVPAHDDEDPDRREMTYHIDRAGTDPGASRIVYRRLCGNSPSSTAIDGVSPVPAGKNAFAQFCPFDPCHPFPPSPELVVLGPSSGNDDSGAWSYTARFSSVTGFRGANFLKIENDVQATGTRTTLRIRGQFLDENFQIQNFSPATQYVHFLVSGGADVTDFKAPYVPVAGVTLATDKISILSQSLRMVDGNAGVEQNLEMDLNIGTAVVAGLYDVDISCGTVKSYSDAAAVALGLEDLDAKNQGASGGSAGGGAHRMKESLKVFKPDVRPTVPAYAECLRKRAGTVDEPVIEIDSGGDKSVSGCSLVGREDDQTNVWTFTAKKDNPDTSDTTSTYSCVWQTGGGSITAGTAGSGAGGGSDTITVKYGAGRHVPKLTVYRTYTDPQTNQSKTEVVGTAEVHAIAVYNKTVDGTTWTAPVLPDDQTYGSKGKLKRYTDDGVGINVTVAPDVKAQGTVRARMSADGYPQNEYWVTAGDSGDLPQPYAFAPETEKPTWVQGYGATSAAVADLSVRVRGSKSYDQDHTDAQFTTFRVSPIVDYNRDGSVSSSDSDKTSRRKPFVFWLNDNLDIVDENNVEIDGDPSLAPSDSTLSHIPNQRDLEDWARLHLLVEGPGVMQMLASGDMSANVRSAGPGIAFVKSADPVGSRDYLDFADAESAQVSQGAVLLRVSSGGVGSLPSSIYDASRNRACLLFEGTADGEGQVSIEINQNGLVIGHQKVWMRLKPIRLLYEHWTVGDTTAREVALENPHLTADSKKYASGSPGLSLVGDQEENRYILLVHGYRMKTWERRLFAQTMVKRLYLSGYKGKCGLFSWPTEWQNLDSWYRGIVAALDPRLYDRSEVQARNAGRNKLPGLLQDLGNRFGSNKIDLVAHSMGNIVASEALSHSNGRLVRRYSACQSAEIAHTVDASAPLLVDRITLTSGIITLNYDPADYFANYPGPNLYLMKSPPNPRLAVGVSGTDIYHGGLSAGAGSVIGYWNDRDLALSSWGVNQLYKPDVGYGYRFLSGNDDFMKTDPAGLIDLSDLVWNNGQGADFATILAFIVQARSLPVGRCGSLGGQFSEMRPLSDLLPGISNGPDDHSAQFYSTYLHTEAFWAAIAGEN